MIATRRTRIQGSRNESRAALQHLDRVQHVDGIETIAQEDDEAMTRAERDRIPARQFLKGAVGTGPADQALARCLAEGEPEL